MPRLALVAVLSAVVATVLFLVFANSRGPRLSRHAQPAPLLSRALTPLLAILPTAGALTWWLWPQALLWSVLLVWLATLAWLPLTRRWSTWAHASWSLASVAGLAYVLAMASWTLTSGLGGFSLAGAWTLWGLEVAAFLLLLAYGWEIHDALGSQVWARRLVPGSTSVDRFDGDPPFVSIHVPSHNEPPELVIATLRSLLDLDYPAYEVLVIDNNTDDDALCAPVEAFCAEHPGLLRFHRLVDWPGFKSGALNYAQQHTDPRATLIAVVDADYQVQPEWLRETVGAFADPSVGFVQTPQDYRDWRSAQYLRSLYYSYDYFFTVSQPSRDERDAAIFGGTMGLVRRDALTAVGGWDEWCVTEDAELSLRLLSHGWTGHHVDRTFGHGIMPLTFEALKRQRFRWCFGGMQILKRHWRLLMPWSRGTDLTLAQRLGYFVGGLQWFGDLVGLLFSLVVMASLVDLALGGGLVIRRLSGLMVLAVPALAVMGLVRAVAVVKTVGHEATWRDALGAFVVWLSLGWVVAMACVRGLVEPRGVFLRTPKVRGDVRWADAVRAHVTEMVLATVAVASAAGSLLARPGWLTVGLCALLIVPVAGWLAAPAHSVAALRADLPPELRRRRAGEWARGWWTPRARVSFASFAGLGAVLVLLLAIVQPTSSEQPRTAVVPRLTRPSPSTPTPTPTTTTPASTSPTSPGTTTPSSPSATTAPSTASPTSAGLPTQATVTTVPTPTVRPTASPTSVPRPTTTPTPSRRPTTTGRP